MSWIRIKVIMKTLLEMMKKILMLLNRRLLKIIRQYLLLKKLEKILEKVKPCLRWKIQIHLMINLRKKFRNSSSQMWYKMIVIIRILIRKFMNMRVTNYHQSLKWKISKIPLTKLNLSYLKIKVVKLNQNKLQFRKQWWKWFQREFIRS